jgi:enoyl-CoA hydratase/carnithine racemase
VVLDSETRPVPDVITALLTYAERLRVLNPTDLAAEIVVLGDPGNVPLRQMQLGLALMHTHLPADTARSLGLMQRVVGHPGPESLQLKPLARLMAERLTEMRRLEDTAERQAQQLRESQRRIEQLNERLEAMRAIERSLNSRPSAAPVPPASAPRPAAP